MEKTVDERLFMRFKKDNPVKCSISDEVMSEAVTKDISMDGVCIQIPERLMPEPSLSQGSRLDIEMYIPEKRRATTICGKIVWHKKNPDTADQIDIGVQFIHADPFDMEDIIHSLSPAAPQTI